MKQYQHGFDPCFYLISNKRKQERGLCESKDAGFDTHWLQAPNKKKKKKGDLRVHAHTDFQAQLKEAEIG